MGIPPCFTVFVFLGHQVSGGPRPDRAQSLPTRALHGSRHPLLGRDSGGNVSRVSGDTRGKEQTDEVSPRRQGSVFHELPMNVPRVTGIANMREHGYVMGLR